MSFQDPATTYASANRPKSTGSSTIRSQARLAGKDDQRKAGSQVRIQPASPEVISSLIFSLSSLTDPAEDLFDSIVPVQEKGVRPPSRIGKRVSSLHGLNGRPASLRGPRAVALKKEIRDPNQSDADEELWEGTPSVTSSVKRGKQLARTGSPIKDIPRRSASLRATASLRAPSPAFSRASSGRVPGIRAASPAQNRNVDLSNETASFGNVSIMPGPRIATPSIHSGETGEGIRKGLPILGRSSSKSKSTKDKVHEMDKERKRRSLRLGDRKSFAPPIDHPEKSPSKAISLSVPASPGRQSIRSSGSVLDTLPEQDTLPAVERPITAHSTTSGSRDARRASRLPGVGGNIAIPPRASSNTQSMGSTRIERSRRQPSPAKGEAFDADEDEGTDRFNGDDDAVTRRIKQLKAQKEKRERLKALEDLSSEKAARIAPSDIEANRGSGQTGYNGTGGAMMPAIPRSQSTPTYSSGGPGPTIAEGRALNQHRRTASNEVPPSKPTNWETTSVADSIDDAVEDYLTDPRFTRKIYHPDTGRQICYSEVGDPDGHVIFCCVGMGTTRYVTAFYDELALTLGLRIMTPERPGIGESEPRDDGFDTPLGWPDDVRLICQHLNISRFSLLAHSAGAIYALATALRMPTNIRGRVHILAPWIPPSQLVAIGLNQEPVPVAQLPYIQRLLRSIPEPLLQAATNFFNMSSITSSLGKSPRGTKKRRDTFSGRSRSHDAAKGDEDNDNQRQPIQGDSGLHERPTPNGSASSLPDPARRDPSVPVPLLPGPFSKHSLSSQRFETSSNRGMTTSVSEPSASQAGKRVPALTEGERATEYEHRLISQIWHLATTNANPAVDLVVCLERKQEIGFRYEDITKAVVFHHGTKDTRVSVENVKWLGERMRRCEVRVLEGEGHGLMASAAVMGEVLTEMGREWEDWNAVVKGRRRQG